VIAFIFPGQGSQKIGMGRALADAFPVCRRTFEDADAALGEPLSRTIFEGSEDQLTLTENAQPAILAVSIAAERLLASRGLGPSLVAGHSLVQQVSAPVRWEAVVARLASEGVTTYVEVGPGTVLTPLVRKIHRDATVRSFGSPDDLAAVEDAAARLKGSRS